MGFFQDLFGDTAAKAATDAANQRIAGLNAGVAQETPYYNQAVGNVTQGYGSAIGAVSPILSSYAGGAGLYGDLTGANGPAGQDRAAALFQNDPGRQYDLQAMQEALQGVERKYGTGGGQGSGGLYTALQDRSNMLANQSYNTWAGRLAPYLGYQLGAGGLLSNLYTGQGNTLGGLNLGLGNLLYNTQAGIGNAQAAGTLGAAQARTAAAGNIANLGAKLLGFAISGASGIPGLGGGGGIGLSNSDFAGATDEDIFGPGAASMGPLGG